MQASQQHPNEAPTRLGRHTHNHYSNLGASVAAQKASFLCPANIIIACSGEYTFCRRQYRHIQIQSRYMLLAAKI